MLEGRLERMSVDNLGVDGEPLEGATLERSAPPKGFAGGQKRTRSGRDLFTDGLSKAVAVGAFPGSAPKSRLQPRAAGMGGSHH